MKISKLFATTLQSKIRLIFLAIASTYNLLLGLYLKDFLVLSQTLTVFYILSVLPCLFLAVEIKSKTMRSVIFIILALAFLINFAYAVYCRRVFPFLAIISIAIVLTCFTVFADSTRKDNPMTKVFVLIVSAFIIAFLFTAYIFVYKQDDVSLTNGQATLWDTGTVKLADEICVDCDTDEEKVKAIYEWMIRNFEYDYECEPIVQCFNVRKTLHTRKGICYDFSHLFASLCRSQNIPCYVVDGDKRDNFSYHHTWDRVCFNGIWWNIDVTFDTVQTKNQGSLYGLREIEAPYSQDGEYFIKRIY